MVPEDFRKRRGFALRAAPLLVAAPIAIFAATPALAQAGNAYTASALVGALPLAIAIGAGAFALMAMVALRNTKRDNRLNQSRTSEQISGLRALVDEYEALLAGTRELTVLWSEAASEPKFLGQAAAVLPPGRRAETVLNLHSWLPPEEAATLAKVLEALRVDGQGFDMGVTSSDGRQLRATGWVLGGAVAVRLRPTLLQRQTAAALDDKTLRADISSARAIFALMPCPAFVRDASNKLAYANPAYLQLARTLGKPVGDGEIPELLDSVGLGDKPQSRTVSFPTAGGGYELVEFPLTGGRAGYFEPHKPAVAPALGEGFEPGVSQLSAVMEVLSTPIAIFNAARELVQFNGAYAELFNLNPKWLKLGMDERSILDRLRTEGMLPNEPDYHKWRAKHLTSYQLTEPTEREPWHLPDGRTIQVIAAPAGPKGGVIYVFDDITARLRLESLNKSLSSVQRETLNALSEGVAVFGTNGRLTLSNPQLSKLWKLPMNELGTNPHIDQIAEACGKVMPEDGISIWRDLKRRIIDLNPMRADTTGRIARADGCLIDYAVTRLPDGQTMMTFMDVTDSANYSRVLKERNDALVTADRLKDAFVQNVSYELRSPLTNIIGFADLLSSQDMGPLNDKQRAYTDYIRASSVTLGVLIDNILDLATVDAGIAELRLDAVDIQTLVEKARAGLAATFPEINGERQLKLAVEVPEGIAPIKADATRLVQVLYNLLSNAARFSEPGGEIRLLVQERGERLLFIVEDDGAPMTEEMKAAMLDPVHSSGRQRGAGLGLAIVRTFVNLHGGTITMEKREPRGNRVVVNLPRDAAALAGAAE
ncbi:two-component sensor histidine kinase [Youhaiella tibetensis]|uniref:histidine kinase n=1 Tax=Paradevosia tibetensis TaxID=1447062 RepID=A0A5B9DL86_9HYPH|nr:PAS domain-containing protein [Youhaiella tibetensis]GGF35865.1 two-component sensor histidine kinase [Youhaiella tibetensis]